MTVPNSNTKPNLTKEKFFYVLGEEVSRLVGGRYYPFGVESLPSLRIYQKENGTTTIIGPYGEVNMRKDDTLRMDLEGNLRFLKGPSRMDNPFQKVMVRSRLKPDLLKLSNKEEEDTPVEIHYPFMAVIFSSNGKERKIFPEGNHISYRISSSWEVVMTYDSRTESVCDIIVRSHAKSEAADILLRKFTEADLLKKRSGMFDEYEQVESQEESDLKYLEWFLRTSSSSTLEATGS